MNQQPSSSLPTGGPGDGISHTAGALIAIPSAFAWFYYGMPDPETFSRQSW